MVQGGEPSEKVRGEGVSGGEHRGENEVGWWMRRDGQERRPAEGGADWKAAEHGHVLDAIALPNQASRRESSGAAPWSTCALSFRVHHCNHHAEAQFPF